MHGFCCLTQLRKGSLIRHATYPVRGRRVKRHVSVSLQCEIRPNGADDSAGDSSGSVDDKGKTDVEDLKKKEKKRLTEQDKRKLKRYAIAERMAKLKAEQEALKKAIHDNREKSLKLFKTRFTNAMLDELGMTKKVKSCNIDLEFAELLDEAKAKVASWKSGTEKLKYECMVPAFEEMAYLLGYGDQLKDCKTKEDYRQLYKNMK